MVQVSVPAQDDGVDAALSGLDEKLSAWLEAMTQAQDALSELSTGLAADRSHASPPPKPAEAVNQEEMSPTVAALQQLLEPSPEQTQADAEPEISDPPPLDEPDEATEKQPAAELQVHALRPQQADPPVTAEALNAVDQDDEIVLSQLDEKTAKALRVLRRLSPVKKSMRALLAEYQASQGREPDDAPARKSWWKRK